MKENKIAKITIKAGCEYQLKIKFNVKNQIVSGLVLQQQVCRHKLGGIIVYLFCILYHFVPFLKYVETHFNL